MIGPNDNVVVDYSDLLSGADLQSQIERAYGPSGFGVLCVSGIPGYAKARADLLPRAYDLANLPKDYLETLTRPEVFHSRGWSHGKEQFQGKDDISKGSFYLNCVTETPAELSASDLERYTPEELKMRIPNVEVDRLPDLKTNTKALASIMIKVGGLVAKHIDIYTRSRIPSYPENQLSQVIAEGTGHVGRLLHYYPFNEKLEVEDDWCGWHNDHGALTALTSCIYQDKDGKEIEIKDTKGGLYAKNRFSEKERIKIPAGMLAFQLGESAQILTGGVLEATPHCVMRS